MAPACPNVRIRPESENSSAMNDNKAVPCASTHAGPTTRTANRKASARLAPCRSRSRMALVICMLSANPMTMTSGVMTLRNRLSLKPSQPSAPSDQMTARIGGSAATSMSETRRKNTTAMAAPNSKPKPL